MSRHEKINYVEFPAKDIATTKAFFSAAFGWSFVDYGPDYAAFSDEGVDGGFFKSDLVVSTENGSALVIFYSKACSKESLKRTGYETLQNVQQQQCPQELSSDCPERESYDAYQRDAKDLETSR